MGIWVSVAWGLAVWGVRAVRVVASASVQELQTASGDVCWRPLELVLSSYPDVCERVITLWCPRWQQCRTPRYIRVQCGHGGSPCA